MSPAPGSPIPSLPPRPPESHGRMSKQSKTPNASSGRPTKKAAINANGSANTNAVRSMTIPPGTRATDSGSSRRGASLYAKHGLYPAHPSNILENEELLSISHSSRAEDYTLSINLVRNALQPMLETQRSIHDEQGQTHSSTSGTTKEFSPEPTVQESLENSIASNLPIDVRSLKDRELRALIARASHELQTRMSSDDPFYEEPRRRSASHVNRGYAISTSAQDGSCYDFHNYEIDDPEVRSFDSRERSSITQERRYPSRSRSGAVAPIRCTDSNERKTDEICYIFTPLSPPRSTATTPVNIGTSMKKKPKRVPPLKKPATVVMVDCGDKTPCRAPSAEFLVSPRSAFDDCSVNSSLSASTAATGGIYFTH